MKNWPWRWRLPTTFLIVHLIIAAIVFKPGSNVFRPVSQQLYPVELPAIWFVLVLAWALERVFSYNLLGQGLGWLLFFWGSLAWILVGFCIGSVIDYMQWKFKVARTDKVS